MGSDPEFSIGFHPYTEKSRRIQLHLDFFGKDRLWYRLAFGRDGGIFLKMHQKRGRRRKRQICRLPGNLRTNLLFSGRPPRLVSS